MVKSKALGTVIKVHDSGNVETNKGYVVQGKFSIGAILQLDEKRNVTVQEKKTSSRSTKANTKKEEDLEKDESDDFPAGKLGEDGEQEDV